MPGATDRPAFALHALTICPRRLRRVLRHHREARRTLALADKPVIIGGGKRGVVSTACYIARTYRRAVGHADVRGAASCARAPP